MVWEVQGMSQPQRLVRETGLKLTVWTDLTIFQVLTGGRLPQLPDSSEMQQLLPSTHTLGTTITHTLGTCFYQACGRE